MKLLGMTGVKGLAKGPAKIWQRPEIEDLLTEGPTEDVGRQIDKLKAVLIQADRELADILKTLERNHRSEESKFIRFQQMLLMDAEIREATKRLISEEMTGAEKAFVQVMNQEIAGLMEEKAGPEGEDYFAGRVSDYQDLRDRVVRIFRGAEEPSFSIASNCIVVAEDLRPTEVIRLLDTQKVRGLVLEKGGTTAHSVLIASAKKIPTVLALGKAITGIQDGDQLWVDGDQGRVLVNPGFDELAAFDTRLHETLNEPGLQAKGGGLPAVTRDGFRVDLEANIGYPEELDASTLSQIGGVGLWRTEFFFLGRETEPTEQEQVKIYGAVSEMMGAKPVNIRTLDAGGDKDLRFIAPCQEPNPSLGLRGIRLGLKHREILRRQLRAILRANVNGNLRIMLPMVTRIEEVEKAKALLKQCQEELLDQGYKIFHDVPLGIMVEVPSTAIEVDLFLPLVDFLSIGTNDLVQYVLATDRQNERVRDIYSPFYPSVIRVLNHVVRSAREKNKPLSICGEMASQPMALPLLIGLGVERLSMAPSRLGDIASLIRLLKRSRCQEMVEQILPMSRREEIEACLDMFLKRVEDENIGCM